jgi:predicted nucleic acid-binding Zn ribbon protein
MKPPVARPSTIGDVLAKVLQRVDPEHQLPAYRIWTFWNDEVGAAIARRAQPTRFRNGILFVTVATHSWMQELQFMKEQIRERLNARLGAALVRDIFFISGSIDADTAPAESSPPDAAEDITPTGSALVSLPPIADAALAAAFARVVDARAKRIAARCDARTKKPR